LEKRQITRPAFAALLFAWLAGGLLLSGCPFSLSLPDDIVRLRLEENCPDWDAGLLYLEGRKFDINTPAEHLQCALVVLRNAIPSQVHRTAIPSRICFLLADRLDKKDERRERFASEGVGWAEIAISEGAGLDGAVHYYLAVNLGIAVYDNTTLAVKNLKRIASELCKAGKLAPNVDHGGPYRVLGMLYLLAPPWPQGIGDGDKALDLLSMVVKHHPGHPLNHIFYARALVELDEGDEEEITRHLKRARELVNTDAWRALRERYLKEIGNIAEDAGIDIHLPATTTSSK